MLISEYISIVLIGIGVIFFIMGILGLLRFPDVYTRLHALTKADNVGLGFIILGLAIQIGEVRVLLKFLLIWLLVLIASATSCYLVAREALRMGIEPWKKS
ncbi:Na(+) H(+) antiporter subunit G [hydrothermal vent metagenome]|uniref:Na(+) H(+) antiporter subunit G n=1 Tax=hydrothermal vent metagenome TaxID=652676 RepID=A0A3B1DZV8_9ZZZZ